MLPNITVTALTKTFRIPQRDPGLKAALRSLIRRQYGDVQAVSGVSFTVQPGEIVGFIGPNGAGKTTTLKMLSGLLFPTGGAAEVAGFIPWERKTEFLRLITMVMGNRNQLTWENTVMDSFYVLGEIYNLPPAQFKRTLDELVSLLDIQEHLSKMARNLSLGERMKCEVAAALLHRPQVVFLDEPTLGLDVSMQIKLRQFIADYNRKSGATVVLTSHYMADVVSLCPRVILIQQGKLLFDGELKRLAGRMAPFKQVRLELGEASPIQVDALLARLGDGVTVLEQSASQRVLRVRRLDTSTVVGRLLHELPLADISVEDPPIEAVIDQVYREGMEV
jgi:ABC-2 type transport system ATP-binding protein